MDQKRRGTSQRCSSGFGGQEKQCDQGRKVLWGIWPALAEIDDEVYET